MAERGVGGDGGGGVSHWLLLYDLAPDYLERRGPLRPSHLAYASGAVERGELLLAGALVDPADRAVFVFRCPSSEPVEEFARADPYVTAGLVTGWQVRRWKAVVGEGAEAP